MLADVRPARPVRRASSSELEERSRRGVEARSHSLWHALAVRAAAARRGARRLRAHLRVVPRARTCSSSAAPERTSQRAVYLAALPILLGVALRRSSSLSASTGGCGATRPRETSCRSSSDASDPRRSPTSILIALRPIGSFPAARSSSSTPSCARSWSVPLALTLRLLPEAQGRRGHRRACPHRRRGPRRARARARAPRGGTRASSGFLDDNPRVRRRRILGISVVGTPRRDGSRDREHACRGSRS